MLGVQNVVLIFSLIYSVPYCIFNEQTWLVGRDREKCVLEWARFLIEIERIVEEWCYNFNGMITV